MYSKRKKKLPEYLTGGEVEKLLSQPNKDCPTGYRNFTILKTFLSTGLRLSELTALKWINVNLTTGDLMVREGKGSKDRTLGIPPSTIEHLKEWRKIQKEKSGECEHVFTTLKGNRIKNSYIQQMVYRYRDKADIKKQVSPHILRHTFATGLLNKTKNIRLVQEALGHSDLSTTQIYTHLTNTEVKEAMREEESKKERKKKKVEKAVEGLDEALKENGIDLLGVIRELRKKADSGNMLI